MKRNRVWVVEWLDDSGERPGNWRPGNDAFDTRAEAERDITEWHKRSGLERIRRYTADPERKKARSK